MDTDVFELCFVCHGQDDGFHQLLDLLVQTTDVRVLLCGPGVHLHRLHPRVVLGGELLQDEVGVFVHAHQVARFHVLRFNQSDYCWKKQG